MQATGNALCVDTLKHILCRCPHAIDEEHQSCITWRHDSTALAWKQAIEHQVEVTAGGCIQFKSGGFLQTEEDDKRGNKTSSELSVNEQIVSE